MTSCSFVAPGLVPQYNGQAPTFSYRRTAHSGDYFGVQMTYMNGASTCYSGNPNFTPVIQNTARGFSVDFTNIPDGVLTISYKNWYNNQPTPIAFQATFGPSPTPRAVVATAEAVATSTTTQTSILPLGVPSTATVYAASTTQTYRNTIIITQTQITTNTNYVSSCTAPLVVSIPSSPTLSSSFPIPSGLSNGCPADDGKYVYTPGGTFQITCGYDRVGLTTLSFSPDNGLLGCINLCGNTQGCVFSTYYSLADTCFLKFGMGINTYDIIAWGAILIAGPSSSTKVSSQVATSSPGASSTSAVVPAPSLSSSSGTSSLPPAASSSPSISASSALSSNSASVPSPSASSLQCPGADGQTYTVGGKIFQIACNYDRGGTSVTLLQSGNSLTGCISLCASTPGCLWSTYYAAQNTCYLKFGQGVPNYNTAASGAIWLNPPSLSSVVSIPIVSSTPVQIPSASSSPPPSNSIAPPKSSSSLASSISIAGPSSSNVVASSSTAASNSASSSSSINSASFPTATSTRISCPDDNGMTIRTASGAFVVECYIDRAGSDLSTQYPDGGLNGCVQLCANTPTCVDVSYVPNGPCYMKKALGIPAHNVGVWGARLAAITVPSSAASSPAATSTGSVNAPTCPGSDGRVYHNNGYIFLIECYTEYVGGDLAKGSPQYFNSFGECVNACTTNTACNTVAFISGICYLKSTVNPGSSNQNAWAAIQIGTYDRTTSQITTTPTARPSLSAAPPSFTGAAGTNIACPGDDGRVFTTSAGLFVIECYIDRSNHDLGPASSNPTSYGSCMNACAATAGCQAVAYVPNGLCYLKNGIGTANTNNGIWGARLSNAASSSATVVASSSSSVGIIATTTSTGPLATSSVVCPGSNGQTIITTAGSFFVECGIDRNGNDMANSPVYPGSYEACIAVCAGRTGCIGFAYIPYGPCYLKSSVGTANGNANIIGGRLISNPASSSVVASLAPASSSVAISGVSSPVQTVTVTTTIGGTGYQCTCTPTMRLGSAASGAVLGCPSSQGSTFTSNCGATYAIECYSDRYGDDIPGGTSYTNTLNECIADCDNTNGCVDVSYIPGSPGPCYKKRNIAQIRQNDNIYGARQLTQCIEPTKLKLHRKRIVRTPTESKKKIQKRGVYGPDFTYTQGVTTTTQTTTSTAVLTTTVTLTPANVGTVTLTIYTIGSTTATVTNGLTVTQTQQTTVTTCPAIQKRVVL